MAEIIRSVKGTRDFYPEQMTVRRWMFDKIRTVSTLFGYQEYEGPCLEFIDLYAIGGKGETDMTLFRSKNAFSFSVSALSTAV